MSLKYVDIKIYVLKTTLNALGMAQIMAQGRNHAETKTKSKLKSHMRHMMPVGSERALSY